VRKVAVFNDTAPTRHFGCEAVMAAIEANVAARDATIIYRHPVGSPWQSDPKAVAAIEQADLVLVNGEGTIHHSKPPAQALARLGPHCSERGKPCFLINATLQANNEALMSDLMAFDGIWVREGRSAEEAKQYGLVAELCGDLSFFHSFPRHRKGEDRGLVLDSAHPKVTAQMATIASDLRADFVAMRHNKKGMKGYKRDFMRWRYRILDKPTTIVRGICTFEQFAAFLARRRFLVTGRFHGLCFAVNGLVPFSAVPLDVWKSEAVLSDIGLHPARLFQPGGEPRPFVDREIDLITNYLASIRSRIAAMFDQILPNELRRI
jgi:hypothetical protein